MVMKQIMSAMVVAVAMGMLALSACGKKEAPIKTSEQLRAEQDAASKAVRENPVYGEQFKSLDKAKATAAAADEAARKTEDALKKLDEPK